MKKRILLPILLLIFSFLLVACLQIPEVNIKSYESTNSYEQKIIETTRNIKNQTVSLVEKNQLSKPRTTIGSVTIIAKEKAIGESTYYAITSSELLEEYDLNVYIPNSKTETIEKYAINEKYKIAIIVFKSRINLDVADYSIDNLPEKINMGQTVLSTGLDSVNSYPVTTKEGTITNTKATLFENEIYFTHDISNNAGEIGTGVYSLTGTLIGINVQKNWYDYKKSSTENILGLSYAIKISEIFSLFNNLNDLEYEIHNINDDLISEKVEETIYQLDNYEKKINDVYNENNSSVVKVSDSNKTQSGVIINKENNTYEVLIINSGNAFKTDLVIETITSLYPVKDIRLISDYLSILKFESNTDYLIQDLTISSNLERGQTLVTIGSGNEELMNSLNVGTLSRLDSEYNELFMHSTKANETQIGSPIFNLNGDLVGLHTGKINNIQTQTGEITAEALSYGLKIEEIVETLNISIELTDYEAIDAYEKALILVTKDVLDKTVTVKTDTGHGSGVLFKREKRSDGSYLYSVLTNQHVVSNTEGIKVYIKEEISITFNNGLRSVRVKDAYVNSGYDLAVLRFESYERIEVAKSNVIDNNSIENPVNGQVVIAVGTPEQVNRTGYVTNGIFTSGPNNYQGRSQLGLLHTAPLNPGNSGGPLFNLKGELIGLNVAKATFSPSIKGQVFIERISISLNINKIASLYNSAINNDSYLEMPPHKPRIGIGISEINSFLIENPHLKNIIPESSHGLVIVEVDDLFDVFGKLKVFDVITHINGTIINGPSDVAEIIKDQGIGFKLVVTLLRASNTGPIDVEVVLS